MNQLKIAQADATFIMSLQGYNSIEVHHTKEQIKPIFLEKCKLDFDIQDRLYTHFRHEPKVAGQIAFAEQKMLMDKLAIRLGESTVYLKKAFESF